MRLNNKRNHQRPAILTSEEFKKCVMPHTRAMYAKAVTLLHNTDDAADVVQEALANLWQNRQRLHAIANIGGYCVLSARNLALDRIRRSATTLSLNESFSTHSEPADDSVSRVDDTAELNMVLRLMQQLPQSQQTVIRLNAVDGCSCEEIARATGFTISNVRQLLSRGRQRLRSLYTSISKQQ